MYNTFLYDDGCYVKKIICVINISCTIFSYNTFLYVVDDFLMYNTFLYA